MQRRVLAIVLLATVVSCKGGSDRTARSASDSIRRPPTTVPAPIPRLPVTPEPPATPAESAREVAAAESIAAVRDIWNVPEIVRRLSEAGLVVRETGHPVRHAALEVEGSLLTLGVRDTLEVYLYADAAARRRGAAGLDTTQQGMPSIENPRYIVSGNLVAILHTPSDRTAERVENALTARHTGGGS